MHTKLINNITQQLFLTETQISDFKDSCTVKTFKRKEILVKQGDVFTDLYFINRGLLKSYTSDKSSGQHILSFSLENYWVADMVSYVTGNGSTTTTEALEDGQVLVFTKSAMEALFAKHHNVESFFRKLLEKRTVKLMQDRYNLISLNAEERYLKFVDENAQLVQRILQKDIASYLGIFPESLSRIRKGLSQKKA